MSENAADGSEAITNDSENKDEDQEDTNVDIDLDFSTKKKKKKKPFNMEELDGALPDAKKEIGNETGGNQEEGTMDDSLDLDLLDLIKTKKKKKKKKDLDELMAEEEEKQENKENGKCEIRLVLT